MDYIERLALKRVLAYVEDNNKNDADEEVANAAVELETWLVSEEARITKEIGA